MYIQKLITMLFLLTHLEPGYLLNYSAQEGISVDYVTVPHGLWMFERPEDL